MPEEQPATLQKPETTPANNTPKKAGKKTPMLAIGAIVLVLIALAVWAVMSGMFTDDGEQQNQITTTIPDGGDTTVIARVNGQDIYTFQVDNRAAQILSSNVAAGVQMSAELQTQSQQVALNQLVNETLLLQAAVDNNISVSDDAIEEQYQGVTAQFESPEQFEQLLAQQGLTVTDVKNDITRQLLIEAYIDTKFVYEDIEVTEDEVQQRYDDVTAGMEADIPEFDAVKADIEFQIRQEKADAQLLQVISELTTKGTIEVL